MCNWGICDLPLFTSVIIPLSKWCSFCRELRVKSGGISSFLWYQIQLSLGLIILSFVVSMFLLLVLIFEPLERCYFNFRVTQLWCNYTSIFVQVGIPIAAGVLLPINGTMLTPSIAGALMGLSSIGVMTNSLLLRFKFSSKQKHIHDTLPETKIYVDSALPQQNQKLKYPY